VTGRRFEVHGLWRRWLLIRCSWSASEMSPFREPWAQWCCPRDGPVLGVDVDLDQRVALVEDEQFVAEPARKDSRNRFCHDDPGVDVGGSIPVSGSGRSGRGRSTLGRCSWVGAAAAGAFAVDDQAFPGPRSGGPGAIPPRMRRHNCRKAELPVPPRQRHRPRWATLRSTMRPGDPTGATFRNTEPLRQNVNGSAAPVGL
jgi:hypothetical protein